MKIESYILYIGSCWISFNPIKGETLYKRRNWSLFLFFVAMMFIISDDNVISFWESEMILSDFHWFPFPLDGKAASPSCSPTQEEGKRQPDSVCWAQHTGWKWSRNKGKPQNTTPLTPLTENHFAKKKLRTHNFGWETLFCLIEEAVLSSNHFEV